MAGRPRKPFNWDIVEALVSLRATERYIAEYLLKNEGVAPHEIDGRMVSATIKLIQRRIEERWGVNFVQFREQKDEEWRVKLRQLQRKTAEKGNAALQIWLGKQDLGQKDQIRQETEHSGQVAVADAKEYLQKKKEENEARLDAIKQRNSLPGFPYVKTE